VSIANGVLWTQAILRIALPSFQLYVKEGEAKFQVDINKTLTGSDVGF